MSSGSKDCRAEEGLKAVGKNKKYRLSPISQGQGEAVRWIKTRTASWYFLSSHRIADSGQDSQTSSNLTAYLDSISTNEETYLEQKHTPSGFLATYKIDKVDRASGFFLRFNQRNNL